MQRSFLFAFPLAALAACASGDEPVAVQNGALTAEQCEYFAVAGKDTICHATSSTKNPYVSITVNVSGCVSGHAGHGRDYIAFDDPSCDGRGCFEEGAPYDGSVECCEGLEPVDGYCAPSGLQCEDHQTDLEQVLLKACLSIPGMDPSKCPGLVKERIAKDGGSPKAEIQSCNIGCEQCGKSFDCEPAACEDGYSTCGAVVQSLADAAFQACLAKGAKLEECVAGAKALYLQAWDQFKCVAPCLAYCFPEMGDIPYHDCTKACADPHWADPTQAVERAQLQ